MKSTLAFKALTFFSFSLWFGGFLFYSSVVIPNAHGVLQDHEIVGMITQRVTKILNLTGVVTSILLLTNFYKSKEVLSSKNKKLSAILLGIVVLCLISLFIFHSAMSTFIDLKKLELTEYKRFYRIHRIYLISSTIQFLALLSYIPLLIKSWQKPV